MTVYASSRAIPRNLDGAVPALQMHRRIMVAADLVVVLLALVAGILVAARSGGSAGLVLAPILALVWPLMLWARQTSVTSILGQGVEEYRRVLAASGSTLLLVALVALFAGLQDARGFLLLTVVLGTSGLLVVRHFLRRMLLGRMARGMPLHRTFVIAAPSRAVEIVDTLGRKHPRYHPVGVWHLEEDGQDSDPRKAVAKALEVGADTILLAPLGNRDTLWTQKLVWATENSGMSLLVSPSLKGIAGPRMDVDSVEGMAFVRVTTPRFSGPARVAKRALDLVGAAVGLVLLSPLLLLVAVLIRRDSEGPAIFKQVRAGVGASTFECWKFRTMCAGADAQRPALRKAQQGTEAASGRSAAFKMTEDPRITRIGHWLRRYSVDELPQLVNVLRGEMSLVGPRPHPLDDVELYDEVANRRLLAKPGMTGLWQVSGRSDLNWDEAVALDLFYVENWSFAADLLILLRTVRVVLKGSGAY